MPEPTVHYAFAPAQAFPDGDLSSKAIASSFKSLGHRSYIRVKLRFDHIYRAADEALAGSDLPLLDVGCGIGLLGQYLLRAARCNSYLGVDCDSHKLQAGIGAAGNLRGFSALFADTGSLPDFSGNVALLDVLHYLPSQEHELLLRQCADRVAPNGVFVIRSVLREAHWRFYATALQEMLLHASGWMPRGARAYPRQKDIVAPLEAAGLSVSVRPLWGRTPYNSYLIVGSRRS